MTLMGEPEAQRVGDDGGGALASGFGFVEDHVQLIERQCDLDGAKHFLFYPRGYGVHIALPFVDGGSAAITEPFG